MKKMEKIRKCVKENRAELTAIAGLTACAAGYIALTVWERKNLTTVYRCDWDKVTGNGPFDILKNSPIDKAFATVEYADGEIGIISLDSPGVMDELYSLMFPGE